eukprot:1215461-Amphidinium_carterae.5
MRKEDRSTQWDAPYTVDISPSQNMAVMKSFQQSVVVDSQRSQEEKFNLGLTVAVAQHDLDHRWSDKWVDQHTSDPRTQCTLCEDDNITWSDCADPHNSLVMEEPDVHAHSIMSP